MEILFCDLCNESVPQVDVTTGAAYYRKGRLICRDCDEAMGGGGVHRAGRLEVPDALPEGGLAEASAGSTWRPHGAAPAPRPEVVHGGGGGTGGIVLGLLAIGFSSTAAWLAVGRLEGIEATAAHGRLELARGLELLQDDRVELETSLAARFDEADARAAERAVAARDEVLAEVAGLRAALAAFAEREDAVAGALTALDQRILAADGRGEERLVGLRGQVESLEKDLRFYSDRLIELEENLRIISAGGPLVTPAVPLASGGAPGASPAQPPAKAWLSLVADLQSDSPGIRLDAIYALGETKDPAVVPHLIPMLGDTDLFVRMATARMLEDLQAREAVPSLIEALEDDQSAVREAAMVALRSLTGKDFGFEPVAQPADRAKKVKLWREWWKKSGEEFLAGG